MLSADLCHVVLVTSADIGEQRSALLAIGEGHVEHRLLAHRDDLLLFKHTTQTG